VKKDDFIPGGSFLTARAIFRSAIWEKPPQYFKLFEWLTGTAAYQDGHTFKGHTLDRGQLFTTYGKIADVLTYRFNKRPVRPTLKEVRVMLKWLQSEGMIIIKPLTLETSPDKGRPSVLTRAYVGLIITIVNYDTYQDSNSYKGKDKGRPSSPQGQLREERKNKKIYTADFESFWKEYPKKRNKDTAFRAWQKRKGDLPALDDLLHILERHKLTEQWRKDGGKFIPYPATWLNAGSWQDEVVCTVNNSTLSEQNISPVTCRGCGGAYLPNDLTDGLCLHCQKGGATTNG
jgi:hypothetical protein